MVNTEQWFSSLYETETKHPALILQLIRCCYQVPDVKGNPGSITLTVSGVYQFGTRNQIANSDRVHYRRSDVLDGVSPETESEPFLENDRYLTFRGELFHPALEWSPVGTDVSRALFTSR